jgi:hypothetical protein
MDAHIATAVVRFRLDVNFGDPVTPAPSPHAVSTTPTSRMTSAKLDTVKTFADPLARPTGAARWHAADRRSRTST